VKETQHDAGKDAKRDAMLTGAGYRVIRYQSKTKPERVKIRGDLHLS
jgi:very-short-patch-repair endonuclease